MTSCILAHIQSIFHMTYSRDFFTVVYYTCLLPLSPARLSPTFLRPTAPSSTSFSVIGLAAVAELESLLTDSTYCSRSLHTCLILLFTTAQLPENHNYNLLYESLNEAQKNTAHLITSYNSLSLRHYKQNCEQNLFQGVLVY